MQHYRCRNPTSLSGSLRLWLMTSLGSLQPSTRMSRSLRCIPDPWPPFLPDSGSTLMDLIMNKLKVLSVWRSADYEGGNSRSLRISTVKSGVIQSHVFYVLSRRCRKKHTLPSLGVVSTDIQTPENPVSRVGCATCSVCVYVDPDSREFVSSRARFSTINPSTNSMLIIVPPAAPTQVNVGTW